MCGLRQVCGPPLTCAAPMEDARMGQAHVCVAGCHRHPPALAAVHLGAVSPAAAAFLQRSCCRGLLPQSGAAQRRPPSPLANSSCHILNVHPDPLHICFMHPVL